MKYFISIIREKKHIEFRFIYILFILSSFVFPILHSNFYYSDDILHSLWGSKSWVHDGRPLAYLIMIFLGGGVIDFSPWTQILGIIILSFSLTMLSFSKYFNYQYSYIIIPIIALNPFFLENLSYRYDSLFMCLSMAVVTVPFFINSFCNKMRISSNLLFNSFIVLVSLNVYQPSINVFLSILITSELIKVLKFENKTNYFQDTFVYLGGLLTGLFLYRIESKIFFNKERLYTSEHKIVVRSIEGLLGNFRGFLDLMNQYFMNSYSGILLISLVLFSLFVSLYCIFSYEGIKRTKIKVFTLILSILLFSINFLSIFGMQSLLQFPTYNPRTFLSLGSFLFSILITPMVLSEDIKRKFIIISYGLFVVIFIMTSASYSNAMSAQYNFWDRLALQMVDDAFQLTHTENKFRQSDKAWVWGTVGEEPIAPFAKRVIKKYPFMKDSLEEKAVMSPYTPSPWTMREMMLSEGLPEDVQSITEYLKDVTTDYHNNPLWKDIERKIERCDIQGYKRHYIFNSYKIDNIIIVDYNKRC